jgi:hypothetical protein
MVDERAAHKGKQLGRQAVSIPGSFTELIGQQVP